MGILEVPRNDRDFEDKSENDEVAQEDNVEEGNHHLYQLKYLYFYLTHNSLAQVRNEKKISQLNFLFDMGMTY